MGRSRRPHTTTPQPAPEPVRTTNVLAGVAKSLRPLVLDEVKARGLSLRDDVDVISAGHVEIRVA